jgi:tRNA(His) 5'-end guanylyltransferase
MKELTLGDRMKTYYENRSQTYLTRYTPTIIRLDGCHFHTFAKGFYKPFDKLLAKTMQMTTKYLCENIQGIKFAYTQSDEISLLLIDYNKEDLSIQTEAWFDYRVQKICSVAASLATLAFNKYFSEFYLLDLAEKNGTDLTKSDLAHDRARRVGATFDARAFNLPKDEVVNYFVWRQQDAIRNSKSALGQANYSQKVLTGLSSNQIIEKCKTELDIDWNDFKGEQKWGTIFYKAQLEGERPKWAMDADPKLFNELRNKIENLI